MPKNRDPHRSRASRPTRDAAARPEQDKVPPEQVDVERAIERALDRLKPKGPARPAK